MEETVTTLDAGADSSQEGTPDLGGQTDPGQSGSPPQGAPTGDGQSPAPQAARSLEDLIEAAEADMATLSPEERRKFIKAGKYGMKSEAEYEARFGKVKTADLPAEGDDKAAGAKPTEKGKAPAPAADLSFLKEALPTLDLTKPENVVKSIKELQGHATRVSQRNAELERFYPEIEQGLIARLDKGQDGIRELYAQMGRPVPEWLGSAPGVAQAPQNGHRPGVPAQAAGAAQNFLEGLKDDDFVPASAVKGMVGTLVEQAVAAALAKVDEKYKPLQQSHEMIQGEIAKNAQAQELQVTRRRGLSDAQLHSDFWGEYHPEERLTEKAEKIWADSVGPDGRILSQPHPEFKKLQAILVHRRTEYLDKAHPAASYEHYLYERLHKSGKMKELMKGAETRAAQALLTKQQQRVQPSLVNKGINGGPAGLGGLRINSVEDVEDAWKKDPKAVREWKKKAMGR